MLLYIIYKKMTEYMCFRCNYKTKYRGSMKNHFNKKKKCERSINSLKYTDNDILEIFRNYTVYGIFYLFI